jgi:hypothetical protein
MTLTLGELGPHLTTSPGQPWARPPTLHLQLAVPASDSRVSISCELALFKSVRLVSQPASQFSLDLTRGRETLIHCTHALARNDCAVLWYCVDVLVCCFVCVVLVSLRSEFQGHPASNPPSDATREATSPIQPSCHRPDGILVASRLSPRRTQSKIRALLCLLGRLTIVTTTVGTHHIVPQQQRCRPC